MGIVSFHKRNCLAILVQAFLVLAFVGGYIAFLVTFYDQNRDQTIAAVYPVKDNSSTEVVTLMVSIISVSPADYTLKVTINLVDVPASWKGSDNTLNHTFTIGVGTEEYSIKPSGNFKPITSNIPLSKGSFDLYPFDDYDADINIYTYDGAAFSTSTVDLALFVNKAIFYGFTFDVGSKPIYQDQGNIEFHVSTTRTDLFRLYPVFLIIAFWLIGISISVLASLIVIWNKRKVEPPILGSAIALIFALPTFRNSAPQSPPIGCTLDVVSFYWAMLFVIISCVGLIVRYIQQAPAAPPGGDIQQLMVTKIRKLRRADFDEDGGDVPMKDMK